MNIRHESVFRSFFDETDELLAEKERLLLAVDLAAPDMEDIDAIFRAAHSIKGGAATFGLTDMTEVTHILETLLDMIRKRNRLDSRACRCFSCGQRRFDHVA